MKSMSPPQFREMLDAAGVEHTPQDVPDAPVVYLSGPEVAAMIGVKHGSLSRYTMPPPDAMIGARQMGWLPETIRRWHAARPNPRNKSKDLSSDTSPQ